MSAKSMTNAAGATVYRFVASTSNPDREGDRVMQDWRLAAFKQNPVILFNHSYDRPIGKGTVAVINGELIVDIEFDQADPFARSIQDKVEKGHLNAVSVRFLADAATVNDHGGYDMHSPELLEISVVSVPANAEALRVKGLNGWLSGKLACDALQERIDLEVQRRLRAIDPVFAARAKAAERQQYLDSLSPDVRYLVASRLENEDRYERAVARDRERGEREEAERIAKAERERERLAKARRR